jgi:hypothetical protein
LITTIWSRIKKKSRTYSTAHHQLNFDALRNFVDTRLRKDHQFTIPPMTAEYLFNEINNQLCHKAKGIDAINVHLLKIGCNDLLPSLLYHYNSSITSGILPLVKLRRFLRRVHAKTKITIDQSLCCQYCQKSWNAITEYIS